MSRFGRVSSPIAVLFLVVLLGLPRASAAQVLYGSLTGNVTDSTGAVLPGVQIVALNVATGVAKEETTDARGAFLFTDLQPGVYNLTLSLSAFRKVTREGLRVDSNGVRRLDVQLDPAAVSESI